jgi:phosphoglycerol transferase MdoB-like AlkP superfamily enzyme
MFATAHIYASHVLSSLAELTSRFWSSLSFSGHYAPMLALVLISLPLLSLSRIGLMLWQWDRVSATGMWGNMLLQGVRVDIIQLGLLVIIPLLLVPLFASNFAWPAWKYFTYVWVIVALTLIVFMEASTPGFIGEYDTRPNRLFIEYLKYLREVLPMLWNGFRIHVFAGLGAFILTVWLTSRLMQPWLAQANTLPGLYFWLAWPFIILLVVFAVRSTTEHRPANPALFAITSDTMVNSLILNSAYLVFYEIYNLKHEDKSSEIYGKMKPEAIMQQIEATRTMLHDQRPLLGSAEIPTLVHQAPHKQRERSLNIVIVLEESLGAGFVESLGGVPVTPELEKLKNEGWWFEQLYATGTRSVRGIEAVVSGYPPTPAQSVVKLSLAQKNFFSLASLLKTKGYSTEFIYGGESHFDNMRGFFTGNGFDSVVDQKDYESPIFKGSWGVSDEDILNKTHDQLAAHHASGQPFFTLVFSVTNHSPFEFPDGRIELHDKEKATDNNAVKYADYALGRFFDKARASDYWKDTIFLVVADHDIRVRGDNLVPIKHFHIPGLIIGADIEPRTIHTVASQIDLPTTLLSIAGVDAEHPMIGRDLSQEPEGLPGRAMMQYEKNYAWMEGSDVVVLRPDKAPAHGRYDTRTKQLNAMKTPENGKAQEVGIEQRALANVMLPAWLYREQLYKLPD